MIMPNNFTFTDLENIADLRQLRNVYLCSYYNLRPGTRKYDINTIHVLQCAWENNEQCCVTSAQSLNQ